MKDAIEKAVKDLGTIRIDNLISTEEPKTGLYPEDYHSDTGHFLYQDDE